MADQKQPLTLAQGVYAALATPRRPDSLESDTAALLDYLDVVASAGVDGFVLFGSTGEFVHFGIEERMRAAALAIKRSRVPVLVNVSHSTLAGAVAIAENAAEADASGVLLSPPSFYRYHDDQLFEFYEQFRRQIAEEMPVYLYNLPMFVSAITPALAERLLLTGKYAGIKESSGDWAYFEALRKVRGKVPFQILMGNEALYVRGRSAGADGTISGVAAALPELIVAIERALKAADETLAQALERRLSEFLQYVEKFPSTVAIRQAGVVRGWKLDHLA
ncbi:MAG: dihydrodipicolinate synthase family protein, partial [Acidobacteriota bacterium]|nr:dihydrodipicolinate synthase family protein [Acidobacteriota bacterium]